MKVQAIIPFLPVLLPLVGAAPTPRRSNPPLRGSKDLIGYTPTEKVPSGPKPDLKYTMLPVQTQDPKLGEYFNFENVESPQPIRGTTGGDDPGPRNVYYDRINSDKLAPPGTDHGATINAQWPMGLSSNRLGLDGAGWARQANTDVMPGATEMAGVDMRLEPHGYRELHWHVAAEWGLVLNGSCRIQAVNENGETFVDDVADGDLWFFPPGVPHSIQALDDGVEFLLVFDQGDFSEDNTFLASEIFLHTPRSVMAQDLGVDVSAFKDIPDNQLYIFNGTPAPKDIEKQNVTTSSGLVPRTQSYSYHLSEQPAHEVAGGTVKIADPSSFPIASMFSAAIVTVHPGGMREIHWHPTSDEWTFFVKGQGRATLLTAPDSATTFDYRAGDIAYFPQSNTHYIQNTGTEDLIFVEVLQADLFTDVALGQWLASTPRQIVSDTLNLNDTTLDKLKTEKQYIVAAPSSNSTQ